MLIIQATQTGTSDTVEVTHEIKNAGKLMEEHHICIYKSGRDGSPNIKNLIGSYVLDGDAAKELKAHL